MNARNVRTGAVVLLASLVGSACSTDTQPAALGPPTVVPDSGAGRDASSGRDVDHATDVATSASDSSTDASVDAAIDAGLSADADVFDAGPADVHVPRPAGPYTRTASGTGAPLASMNGGRLLYRHYANQGQTNAVHILPDFSHAGYRGGGVAIPDVRVQATVSPGAGDDRARIQTAIDAISQRAPNADGFRGAVLLSRGTYEVGDTLRIGASGVVLRGEGQGTDGTVLIATLRAQHSLLDISGIGRGFGEVQGTRVRVTSAVVAVGSTSFDVEAGHPFSPGDTIVVLRTPNQTWIDDLGMGTYGWKAGAYAIGHERTVVQVRGQTLWVDIPIVDTIEDGYGGGAVYRANMAGRLANCGVEDLRLVSEYTGAEDEAHAWTGITLSRTTDSWVRRVTAQHFGFAAVDITAESNFNTVEDVAMLDPISQITGSRRYSFNVSDGVGNLFQRCFSREGRHSFVTGSRVTGPNVWLDCLAVQTHNDDGPHHRWSTGLLFDNTQGGLLNVQNRRTSGTGHGWSGAQVLFWNATATSLICDSPRGAMNWAIGCIGTHRQGVWPPAEPDGWFESIATPVAPRSLYLQQLEDRLGRRAVEAVTIAAQLEPGGVAAALRAWAGEGRLDEMLAPDPTCSRGVPSGNVCCAASCGTCGGTGCSQRPGGAAACCTTSIRAEGRSCAAFPPPCVL